MEPKHRARHRASATKGTTALRHHQDGKGSSSQPTGYAVHVTPYLCAEKFIKSLTTDVRLGGGFFVCANAAHGSSSTTLVETSCAAATFSRPRRHQHRLWSPFSRAHRNRHRASAHPSSSTSPRRSSDIKTLALLFRDVRHHRRLAALRRHEAGHGDIDIVWMWSPASRTSKSTPC